MSLENWKEILGISAYILGIFTYILMIVYYLPKYLHEHKKLRMFHKYKIVYLLVTIIFIITIQYYFQEELFKAFGYNIRVDKLSIPLIIIVIIIIAYIYFNYFKKHSQKVTEEEETYKQSGIEDTYKQSGTEDTYKQSGIEETHKQPNIEETWRFLLRNYGYNLPDDVMCIQKISDHFEIPENRAKEKFESACEQFLKE